jgi:phosphoglycerate kinase
MARKLSVRDLREFAGSRVFCRVDFNVPMEAGRVTDATRIASSLPTIELLRAAGARVILASHLGRPKGKPRPEFSLAPVAAYLEASVRPPVAFVDDCVGPKAERASAALAPGSVLLLENLRFHPGEEANDDGFAEALARLGDLYVNDAFGSAHRAHASTAGVPARLKPAAAGLLMQSELDHLGRLLDNPARPFVAILGGAKISGKIEVLTSLLEKVDRLLVGGAMMFTFLRAQGHATGRSLVEEDRVAVARSVLDRAQARGVQFVLPVDCLVSVSADGSAASHLTPATQVPDDAMGVDIGPATVKLFADALRDAKTVLWNGPMGIFEVPAFATGTRGVAQALAEAGARGAVTIVGGGDSVAAVQECGLAERITHLSTGGGASLEFLEGKALPGVVALDDRVS